MNNITSKVSEERRNAEETLVTVSDEEEKIPHVFLLIDRVRAGISAIQGKFLIS